MDHSTLLPTLAECYHRQGIAADQLPHTEEFERLYQEVQRQSGAALTRAEFCRTLVNARKRGILPTVR
jgi:hypothetical protein